MVVSVWLKIYHRIWVLMEFGFCQHIEDNDLTQVIRFRYDQTFFEIAIIGAIAKSQ